MDDAIEKIARALATIYGSGHAPAYMDDAKRLVGILNAVGFAIIDRKPTPSALLTLGLLSGAGPQSREDYSEALASIIGSQEVRHET